MALYSGESVVAYALMRSGAMVTSLSVSESVSMVAVLECVSMSRMMRRVMSSSSDLLAEKLTKGQA